ncbi:MAG: hypothetical protein AB1758_29545 [Candidatus Eremiobacterota bacterium]
MLDDSGLKSQKLDPPLRELLEDPYAPEILQVIVQTVDGLKDEDRRTLTTLRGTVKDDLYIINAFSADIPRGALETLILAPRVVKVYHDAPVSGG